MMVILKDLHETVLLNILKLLEVVANS